MRRNLAMNSLPSEARGFYPKRRSDRAQLRGRCGTRKTNLECGAATAPVVRANASAMKTHEMFGDGQAQSGARNGAAAIDTVKAVEDALHVVGGNAFPFVGNAHHGVARLSNHLDEHLPSAAVLRRVVEQIRQDLLHP